MDIFFECDTEKKGMLVSVEKLQFKIGDNVYTVKSEYPEGFILQKINEISPLEMSINISPIHTNKIKIV